MTTADVSGAGSFSATVGPASVTGTAGSVTSGAAGVDWASGACKGHDQTITYPDI